MMTKKVVMLLLKDYAPDPRLKKEAEFLVKNGFEVTILAWQYKKDYPKFQSITGVKIIHLGPKINGSKASLISGIIKFSLKAIRYCIKHKYDILHCHDLTTLHIGVIMKMIKGRKMIYDSHEHYPSMLKDMWKPLYGFGVFIEYIYSLFFDMIITTNSKIANKLKKYKRKIFVVSNFIDLKWYDQQKIIKTGVKTKLPIVLYEGIIKANRGLKELIDAKKYMKNKSLFLIVGDGPYLQQLEQYTKKQNIKNIILTGYKPYNQMPSYIKISTCGVNLLKRSFNNVFGNPNKIFEYIAGNIPMVVTNLPLMTEVIERANCGVIVKKVKPKEIAEKLDMILENKNKAKQMGKEGRKIVEKFYNWEMQTQSLKNAYDYLISK